MTERQAKTEGTKREAKRCEQCGCKTWLRDALTGEFHGPYHRLDCPQVPGGVELAKSNELDRLRWMGEEYVPKAQGQRILRAILLMMASPSREVLEQRRAAILAELATMRR